MSTKKISRERKRDLNQTDAFINSANNAVSFLIKNKITIASICASILIVVFIFLGVYVYNSNLENNASILLQKAQAKYNQLIEEKKEPKEALNIVSNNFNIIINDYSKTKSATFAIIDLANYNYNTKNYKNAIKFYKQALEKLHKKNEIAIKNLILSSIAYSYEAINDKKNAMTYFSMIVNDKSPILKGDALFNLGCIYEKTGNKKQSNEAFNQIISNYQNSIFNKLAKDKI